MTNNSNTGTSSQGDESPSPVGPGTTVHPPPLLGRLVAVGVGLGVGVLVGVGVGVPVGVGVGEASTCSIANTPPPFVPAYTRRDSIGSMASALTKWLGRPMALQVAPASVLLKTPPSVPA